MDTTFWHATLALKFIHSVREFVKRCIAVCLLLYFLGLILRQVLICANIITDILMCTWANGTVKLQLMNQSNQPEGQAAARSRLGFPSTTIRPLSGGTEGHN